MCYTGFEPSALQPKPQGLRFNGHGGDYQLAIIVMKWKISYIIRVAMFSFFCRNENDSIKS